MCLLLETIRIDEGIAQNILYHNERINNARKLLFNRQDKIEIGQYIHKSISPNELSTLCKCRLLYAEDVHKIEFLPYEMPTIKSLKIITDNHIDYSCKFNDRSQINKLFAKRVDCDDILVVKHGFITDSSYANVLFYNGKEYPVYC